MPTCAKQYTPPLNIDGIPRNACGASGDIFIWYLNVYDSKETRGKGETLVILYWNKSPVSYGRKIMCRVTVFFKCR